MAIAPSSRTGTWVAITDDRSDSQEARDPASIDAAALLAQLREIPTSELEDTFRELDTLHNATGAHRLLVLSVLDERDVGQEDGALDTVGWVTWTARLTQSRARALVKTARALRDRPEITKVALDGRLSGEQLDAVVQVATPETDEAWVHEAPGWSATSLRAAAKNQRSVTNDEATARDRCRELSFRWDKKRAALRVWGWIPDADGSLVETALTRRADQAGANEDGSWDSFPARCADALVNALDHDIADDDARPHRAAVVVHTPEVAHIAESTAPGACLAASDEGIPIANDTARWLSCDAVRQILVEDANGVPLRLGRSTQTVPTRLYRLLKHRDRHCRAPGCNRTRGLQGHHRQHWIDDGLTDLDNLILLCRRHHRLLHQNKWQICGDLQRPETVEFHHWDGRIITPYQPTPLDARVRERVLVSIS